MFHPLKRLSCNTDGSVQICRQIPPLKGQISVDKHQGELLRHKNDSPSPSNVQILLLSNSQFQG